MTKTKDFTFFHDGVNGYYVYAESTGVHVGDLIPQTEDLKEWHFYYRPSYILDFEEISGDINATKDKVCDILNDMED